MVIAFFFVVGAVLAYQYRDVILPVFLAPLGGQTLIYLTPGGGFTFALLVSVYAGLALAFPVLLQQLYAFLGPALPEKARKKSAVILVCSLLLLVAGILFGYFIAVPSALHFLYGFADGYVESALTADSYTNFVVAYTIGIGIVFQIPLLLLLMHAVKPLKPGGLMRSQKWVILGAFIVAAILTPTPDPVNQAIMAGPVIVVYQLGVIAVLISIYKASRKEKVQLRRTQKAQQRDLLLERALEAEAVSAPAKLTPPAVDAPIPELLSLTDKLEKPVALSAPKPAPVQQPQMIDGIIRRPADTLKVPQRPAQPQRPATRPTTQVPTRGPARGFYVDGIIAPRTA